MALTTLQFWQQQLVIHAAAQQAAQADLAVAQAAQQSAAKTLADDLKTMAQIGTTIAAQRARLATTTVPADANALIVQITAQVIAQRTQQGLLLDDQDRLDAAGADVDAAGAALARSAAHLAAVQAAIAAATTAGKQRDALKAAIALPPMVTVKADAAALLASSTATHAATRLGKNFPPLLLTIAGKRHATRRGRLASLQAAVTAAEDAQIAGQAADAGLAGTVLQRTAQLQRAQAVLAEAVANAASRYARALAVLQKLEAIELDATGSVPDVLSTAEKAQLVALAAAGAAAEPTAETLDTDQLAIYTAEDALAAQVLTQIAADVDQLATDPTIAIRRGAIVTAGNDYGTALAAFAAANKADLDQWEAVVPDAAWQLLLDYQEGLADLAEIAATDLPSLATAMDGAETAATTAMAAAEVAQRRADAREAAIALRQARLANARAAIASRLPSAVRGDSY